MLNYASNNKQDNNSYRQRNHQIQATPFSLKFQSPRNKKVRNPDTPSFQNIAKEETPAQAVVGIQSLFCTLNHKCGGARPARHP